MEECRAYFESVIKELSTDSLYWGRNDYRCGDVRAAKFIIDQAVEMGALPASQSPLAVAAGEVAALPPYKSAVLPLGGPGRWAAIVGDDPQGADYQKYMPFLQNFSFDLNVMRGAMSLSVDGREMIPTVDFTAKEFSPSCKGRFDVKYLEDRYYDPDLFVKHLNSGEYANSFVVVDWTKYNTLPFESYMERYRPYLEPLDKVGGIILKDDAGTYVENTLFPYFKARAHFVTPEPVLFVGGSFPCDAKEIETDIESELIKGHDAHNVAAFLPGTDPDAECITFIAHYDHLGAMGSDNVFPGANDNASGVAMLLSLMKYWTQTEHGAPLQFIFLDAEESNLLGAFYNAANPLIPLDRIKCVLNCDMVGDGGDTLHCQCEEDGRWIIDALKAINDSGSDGFADFFVEGVDDNSDHYAYEQAGVPSTYYETKGEFYDHYHTPRDTYGHTTSCNYHRLFRMFTEFVKGSTQVPAPGRQ